MDTLNSVCFSCIHEKAYIILICTEEYFILYVQLSCEYLSLVIIFVLYTVSGYTVFSPMKKGTTGI